MEATCDEIIEEMTKEWNLFCKKIIKYKIK